MQWHSFICLVCFHETNLHCSSLNNKRSNLLFLSGTLEKTTFHQRIKGRHARWKLLPKQRKQRREAIATARKGEVDEATKERRLRTVADCEELLANLPEESRAMLNFESLGKLSYLLTNNNT